MGLAVIMMIITLINVKPKKIEVNIKIEIKN